jgi:hypothetical protein
LQLARGTATWRQLPFIHSNGRPLIKLIKEGSAPPHCRHAVICAA